jgi:DNA-binding transcriptional MerR regulator
MDSEKPRYTALELAHLAGVSARTVRFYVQRGLISAPSGRGRGAHFDDRHLGQLRGIKLLRGAGLDLAAIRRHREDLEAVLRSRGFAIENAENVWASFASSTRIAVQGQGAGGETRIPAVSALSAIHVAPGLDLMVGGAHRLPPPARLAELVRLIRAFFGVADEAGPDDDD